MCVCVCASTAGGAVVILRFYYWMADGAAGLESGSLEYVFLEGEESCTGRGHVCMNV